MMQAFLFNFWIQMGSLRSPIEIQLNSDWAPMEFLLNSFRFMLKSYLNAFGVLLNYDCATIGFWLDSYWIPTGF